MKLLKWYLKWYLAPFLVFFGTEAWYIKLILEAHMRLWDDFNARSDIIALGFIWGVALPVIVGVIAFGAFGAGWLAGGAPGGESPSEKGSHWAKVTIKVLATIGGLNILWAIGALILRYQHNEGIPYIITLITIGLLLAMVVLGEISTTWSKMLFWFYVAALILLVGEGLSPGLLHNSAKFQLDPVVVESETFNSFLATKKARQNAVLVLKKMKSCNMTAQELLAAAKNGARTCSITKTQFHGWKIYLKEQRKKHALPDISHSISTVFSKASKTTPHPQQKPVTYSQKQLRHPSWCHVKKEVLPKKVIITFPNCWSGPWKTDLPGKGWNCVPDRDIIQWRFGKYGPLRGRYSIDGVATTPSEEFIYPLDGIGAYALGMNINGAKLTLQWNVWLTKKAPNQAWWARQKDKTFITCRKK